MAGTSLLALLDDIASVLDDVALMTKMAAKKTAGVLGTIWRSMPSRSPGCAPSGAAGGVGGGQGSFRNKLILVPAAIAISALVPWLITPLLMLGAPTSASRGRETGPQVSAP